MKICKIKLNNYLHFKKGLEIDLTYPIDHEKKGQPLDKICFIGQSGTGKTTLLNLIKHFTARNNDYDTQSINLTKLTKDCVEIFYKTETEYFSIKPSNNKGGFYMVDYSKKKPKIIRDIDGFLKGIEAQIKRTHTFINFPFCVVGPHNVYTSGSEIKKGNIKFDGTSGELEKEKEISKFDRKRKIWDFTPEQIDSIWNIVFNELDEYIVKYQNKEIELAKKVKENEKSVTAEVKKNKNWEKKNPNPIKKIAKECLNLILEHFKLEVETNIDKYPVLSPKENRYIIIKAKCNGEEVGYQYLSTGTKQIMLTATPLFFLQPKNTIVLFDQPETSLYPNIQWLLPKVYIEISPNNNQFHFATHSPVVASAFDPWEVVELEFDNHTGRVLQKPYFEGKKLKESYIINPKLLRWDSNYKKLFGLKFQGNEERIKTLRELSTIDALLRNNKLSKSQREENTKKYFRLAGLLDWQLGEDAKTK